MTDTTREALKQLAQEKLNVGGGLIYSLRDGVNHYEINVTMAAGSRDHGDRAALALDIARLLAANAEQPAVSLINEGGMQQAPLDGWSGAWKLTLEELASAHRTIKMLLDANEALEARCPPQTAQPVSGAVDERIADLEQQLHAANVREAKDYFELLEDRNAIGAQNAILTNQLAALSAANQVNAQPDDQARKVRHAYENIRNNYVGWSDDPNFKVIEKALFGGNQVNAAPKPLTMSKDDIDEIADKCSSWFTLAGSKVKERVLDHRAFAQSMLYALNNQVNAAPQEFKNTDSVVEYLVKWHRDNFKGAHYAKYIREKLAKDFAWELARVLSRGHAAQPDKDAERWCKTLDRIATYPKTRADELSAEGMRELARAAIASQPANQPRKDPAS